MGPSFGVFILSFALGLQQAVILPSLPLYIDQHLNGSGVYVFLFLVFYHGSSLITNVGIPLIIEKHKKLNYVNSFNVCCYVSAVGYLLLAYFDSHFAFMLVVLFIIGPASCHNSLFFSYIRCSSPDNKAMVVSRGILSAAWVFGPLLSMMLIAASGFTGLFIILAVANILFAITSSASLDKSVSTDTLSSTVNNTGSVQYAILAFMILVTLQGTNILATFSTPIILVSTHSSSLTFVGLVFGVCAASEVLMFWMIAKHADLENPLTLILAGAIIGVLYYLVLGTSSSPYYILLAQPLNAFFIASAVGGGMAWFQTLIPGRLGLSTGIYMNVVRVSAIVFAPLTIIAKNSGSSYQDLMIILSLITIFGVGLLFIALLLKSHRSLNKWKSARD